MQHVAVVNMLGQVVYSQAVDTDNATLDLTSCTNGMYIVRITTEMGTLVKRIAVQK